MEASLILLQELLCWSLQDITYLNQNQRKTHEKNKMTMKTRFVYQRWLNTIVTRFSWNNILLFFICRSILKQWLWADYMLYDHFKKLLQKRLIDFGADAVQRKVKLLKVRDSYFLSWISWKIFKLPKLILLHYVIIK